MSLFRCCEHNCLQIALDCSAYWSTAGSPTGTKLIEQPKPAARRTPMTATLFQHSAEFIGSQNDKNDMVKVHVYRMHLELLLLRNSKKWIFEFCDELIEIVDYHVIFESAEEGSILAKFRIVFTFVLGSYGAIAAYPSFKEALPMIEADIMALLLSPDVDIDDDVPGTRPSEMSILFRKEEEIEEEILANI